MPCKNCKKNAKMMVDVIKEAVSKPNNPKSDCDKKREKELGFLSSPEGKYLLDQIKLTSTQNIILWVGAYIPLLIGYITIVRFIINLF